jgi:hypothetical protein
MNVFDNPDRPLPAVTLTIKTPGAPAVHLTYDPERPYHEAGVTVLDQSGGWGTWSFNDVVKNGFVFLLRYIRDQCKWPAELRAPCAGRTKADQAS